MAKKKVPSIRPIKKGKYDITVKIPSDMTADDLLKLAVNTPIKNSKTKKK